MKELIFATNNQNKLAELQDIIEGEFKIRSLREIGFNEEIPEEQDTLAGNALQKALTIYKRFGKNCFADDTGLEIDALNGAPGVYSARFAGENATYTDNVEKVLNEMKGKKIRTARFKTVIALILEDKEYFFEGKVEGEILESPRGKDGFGYDPIFLPTGFSKSFAEMPSADKHKISHRGKATRKFVEFLKKIEK